MCFIKNENNFFNEIELNLNVIFYNFERKKIGGIQQLFNKEYSLNFFLYKDCEYISFVFVIRYLSYFDK